MEIDNFDNTMKAFKDRTPFQPFTVVLLNGDRYEVDHRDAFIYSGGVGMLFAPGNVPIMFDHEGVNQFIGDLINRPATDD